MPIPQRIRAIIDAYTPADQRGYYYRMAEKESGGNPDDVSGTGAKGIFQFTKGTGRTYGLVGRGGDIRGNAVANTKAMVRLTEDNRNILRNRLGREPSHSELAVAHQQGADTAANMITGVGNASKKALAVNKIPTNASPLLAAN